MFGSWLARKIEIAGTKSGREDLEHFVESLRRQSDQEIEANALRVSGSASCATSLGPAA
jgi:hypothetical protein